MPFHPGSGHMGDMMGMRRKKKKKNSKVGKVMREFKSGSLRSSSGAKVTDRDQALAIALSEDRRRK